MEVLRANVPPLVAQRRIALLRLAVLSGRPPAAFPPDVEACEAPPRLSSPIPVGDGAALLRRRPDVRQAERTLAAATARIGVATADLYPTVSFGVSAGSGGLLGSFGQESTLGWSLGPLLSWTFPNTRVARSRIAQADAAAQGALAQFDRVVLNALLETEINLTQYTQELEGVTALTAARDFSAQAAREADALYRGGREDFLTVLDAERTRANAEASLASAQTRLVSDQIALFLSLGGDGRNRRPRVDRRVRADALLPVPAGRPLPRAAEAGGVRELRARRPLRARSEWIRSGLDDEIDSHAPAGIAGAIRANEGACGDGVISDGERHRGVVPGRGVSSEGIGGHVLRLE
ncbi:TolC family protein [Corallococcus sp. CA054B]|nr:TolC family protein [Corallococcus sp. CA054B]